jgi:hypothetical protein
MPGETMTLISTVTVSGSSTTNIQFASITGTYTDIVAVISARGSSAATNSNITMYLNGNNSNGSFRFLYGNGSAASSGNASGYMDVIDIPAANATASTFGNGSIYFPNYAGATNKSWSVDSVYENNATTAGGVIRAGLWSSTSAITQIDFTITAGNYVAGSTISLYGILKGSGGASVS